MRKPKPLRYADKSMRAHCYDYMGERRVRTWTTVDCDSKHLRKLATWLLKAADWLEEKEGEKNA